MLNDARRQQIPTKWGLGGTRRYSTILSGRATLRATAATKNDQIEESMYTISH